MAIPFNIVVIGTGNVAQHILQSLNHQPKVKVLQIFNHRKSKSAKLVSKLYNCTLETNYQQITPLADIYIIAVKDEAIAEVIKNLIPLKIKGIIVHTSGSMDVLALKKASKKTGVFYPLQTFYKGAVINWKDTPILIEASTKNTQYQLHQLASLVSNIVKVVDSQKRLQMHLAAVFACNFTNAMYVAAYQIIQDGLGINDAKLLFPIMEHSFNKLKNVHPIKAQTGPAMRNDQVVIKKHLELIKSNKQLLHVYKNVSDLIVSQQKTIKK